MLARERKASSRKGKRTNDESSVLEAQMPSGINNGIPRYELGRMDQVCIRSRAKFWMEEKDRNSNRMSPTFSICCAHGKVLLPRLIEPPPYLLNLYTSSESDAVSFHKNIRCYNNVLACTFFGADIEKFQGRGVSNF